LACAAAASNGRGAAEHDLQAAVQQVA